MSSKKSAAHINGFEVVVRIHDNWTTNTISINIAHLQRYRQCLAVAARVAVARSGAVPGGGGRCGALPALVRHGGGMLIGSGVVSQSVFTITEKAPPQLS